MANDKPAVAGGEGPKFQLPLTCKKSGALTDVIDAKGIYICSTVQPFHALLIVEANQEQGVSWDLASSTLAFLTLFVCAHLAIRRFAPYADPVLREVVREAVGVAGARVADQVQRGAAGRDIGPPPAVADAARRESCRHDFRLFCETYAAESFPLEWSPDHLTAISKIEGAVLRGELFVFAMPRGSRGTRAVTTRATRPPTIPSMERSNTPPAGA